MTDKPLTTRLLALIALFEGSRGGAINVWDEQLLSLGTLHYAVGQGSGARFLMRVQELDPAGYLACVGPHLAEATGRGIPAIQAFCRVNIWKSGTKWAPAFAALSRLPAFAQADRELAEPYLQSARTLARRYGLTSEVGLAWAFDRCVQQGGSVRPHVDAVYARVKGQSEGAVMCALANAYAATANPKYAGVVRARSLTVAQGSSARSGYPGHVDLRRDFGLRAEVPWDAPQTAPGVPRVFLVDGGGKTVLWGGKQSDVYAGQPLTHAWLSQLPLLYPPGSKATLTTPTGDSLALEVFPDGAIKLSK